MEDEARMASFRITALPREQFVELFGLPDAELAARGARRVVADSHPGYPCRVSLVDAEVGERLVLLSLMHQPADSPYRSSGPIYVREAAVQANLASGEVPLLVRRRLLSFRAYDGAGMMRDAEVADGRDLEAVVERLFGEAGVAYLHVHNAKPGCYSCRIDRA
jgi:hypothetical protein